MMKPATPTALTFLGGAGTVTGAKYLLETAGRRLLLDAGLFQGDKALREMNWAPFPVPPDSLTDVLLTHAHMDHVGYLPRLVALGFRGAVWTTAATAALADIVLQDAANLQEMDADSAAKGGYSKHAVPQPLYTRADIPATMKLFREVDFGRSLDLGDGITATWVRSGHILGSASLRVTTPGGDLVYSGDLGRHGHPVLRPRETPRGARTVLIETTYGDREHPEWAAEPHEELADAIRTTAARGGSVLIPAFAVDRTEILLVTLADMVRAGRIPALPVYVDSPMGLKALDVYQDARYAGELNPGLEASELTSVPGLREVRDVAESIALNDPKKPCLIISSSGMATGGRVVHHLEHMLPNPKHTIVFTGYQAHGTRGRSLLDGATHLKMYGRYVPVKARVLLDDGFSAHADASELLDWLGALDPAPTTVYCVHGEDGAPALAARIRDELGLVAVVPTLGERVLLG